MKLRRKDVYEVAVKTIEDAEVASLLEHVGDKAVICILDDDYNIVKRFYDDNEELVSMAMDTNAIRISEYSASYYFACVHAFDCDGNEAMSDTYVERPVVCKAELVYRLVRIDREIKHSSRTIEFITDPNNEKFN